MTTQNSLARTLQKIRNSETVNFDRLAKQLEQLGVSSSDILRCLKPIKRSRNTYYVQVINEDLFQDLVTRFGLLEVASRADAARTGNSHRHRVEGSTLLVKTTPDGHPEVVVFDQKGVHLPSGFMQQSDSCLLIENLENFLCAGQTLQFCRQRCGFPEDVEVDIFFGQGNAIANRLHRSFLSRYKHIYALFDLDLGGLKIFKNLLFSGIKQERLSFLLPDDAQVRLERSPRSITASQRAECLQYKNTHPHLEAAAALIRSTGRTLEQELYLIETTE